MFWRLEDEDQDQDEDKWLLLTAKETFLKPVDSRMS
jgi:hypothetical protein